MLQPMSQRIVLEKVKEEEKKVGGLLLPTQTKVSDNMAKVVAVAEDVTQVAVGDTVVYETYEALAVEHEGNDYLIVRLEHVVAIVR